MLYIWDFQHKNHFHYFSLTLPSFPFIFISFLLSTPNPLTKHFFHQSPPPTIIFGLLLMPATSTTVQPNSNSQQLLPLSSSQFPFSLLYMTLGQGQKQIAPMQLAPPQLVPVIFPLSSTSNSFILDSQQLCHHRSIQKSQVFLAFLRWPKLLFQPLPLSIIGHCIQG